MGEQTVFPFNNSSPSQRPQALQHEQRAQQPIDAPECISNDG